MVNCKVCDIDVPPRKTYKRNICEACQKFFRRYCSHRYELSCLSGSNRCIVNYHNRRRCLRCRVEKSVAVGMRSKFLAMKDTTSDGASSCSDSPSKEPVNYVESMIPGSSSFVHYSSNYQRSAEDSPSIKLPMIFYGNAAEASSRNPSGAFTHLRGYEFAVPSHIDQLSYRPVNSPAQAAQYFSDAIQTSPHLEPENFGSEAVLEVFKSEAIQQLVRPSGSNNFPFTGSYDERIPFESAPLELDLAEWDPPSLVCALLCGIVFVNGNSASDPNAAAIRQRLYQSLDLVLSRLTAGDPERLWQMLENCRRILLNTTDQPTVCNNQSFAEVANCFPAVSVIQQNLYR